MIISKSPACKGAPLRCEQLEAREVPATLYAINAAGRLLTFDSANPSVLQNNVALSGLVAGERITDIDVRPGTLGLYGRSDQDRLYLISPFSGFSTRIGGVVSTSAPNVGVDFDPLVDRLRVVSNVGENIALNPIDGSLSNVGATLTYLPGDSGQGLSPRLTGVAFTNSVPFPPTTTLYGLDHIRNTLVRFVGDPNNGQLVTVGTLGFDFVANLGFDIDPVSNIGYAAMQLPGATASFFASIDLITGAATFRGPIGPNRNIVDVAVARGSATISSAPATVAPVLAPGVSTPFFSSPSQQPPLGVPTSPLFPTLTQPLAPGTFSPLFSANTSPLFGSSSFTDNSTFGTSSTFGSGFGADNGPVIF